MSAKYISLNTTFCLNIIRVNFCPGVENIMLLRIYYDAGLVSGHGPGM